MNANETQHDGHNTPLTVRAILPWAILLLALLNLPYLTAWLLPPPDKLFVGTFVNPDDLSTYLAAIRQGGAGAWLFHFPFSPEPWQPKLMLLPYLLVGKLMGALGGTAVFWFHLFRLSAAAFALLMVLVWVRVLFADNGRLQRTAWFIIIFGAGVGWLAAILRLNVPLVDLRGPEWAMFMALLHTPHFALGLGLELLLFVCVINMVRHNGRWWTLAAAGTAVASGLTYAYHIPVTGAVIGLYLLHVAWRERRIPWRGAAVLLPLTLLLAYYAILSNQDPYFAHYAQFEHVIRPPAPLGALVGAGFLGLFALLGVRGWLRNGRTPLVPIWAGANLLLLYLPIIQYTGRFALGLMVPVATLAAFAVESRLLPWLAQRPFYPRFARFTPTPYASLRRVFFFLVVPSTIILPFLLTKTAVDATGFPTYVPAAEVAAAEWLGAQTEPDDLVLAYYPMGNFLPRVMPGKVFLGQLDFTTDLDGKLALVEQFWQPETDPSWREALLAEWGVDYVYAGRYEAKLGETAMTPPGQIVYDQGGVIIYKIE